MEYLVVKATKETDDPVQVLVNGEKNGYVGEVLTLEEGFVEVSVDMEGAETKEIELVDTTPTQPMEVTINV